MAVTLDMMEYATSELAQAAYVASDGEAVKENYETGIDQHSVIGDLAGTDYWCARKIVVSGAIICSAASIYLTTRVGTPSGDMTFRLETDVGAEPSGTLAHANATGTLTPTDNAWNKRSFVPFSLAADTYWLVIYIADQGDNNYLKWGTTTDGGAATRAWSTDHGVNWSGDNFAQYFRLYGIHLQCYSESTIKQQGTYSLKGIAKITASLNDTLTRTVDPTIDLTGKDRIKFWIRASRMGSNIKIGIRDSGSQVTEITPNIISANIWQMVNWYIANLAKLNKDAIDRIIVTIVNADSDNTFYLDDMQAYALAQMPVLV